MTSTSPLLTLNNGVQMPAIGLGVFQSSPEDTVTAVESAIAHGYRLIDTAAAYFNERQVGEGIRRSGIERRHVFVTTKLWMRDYGFDRTLRALDVSLRKLGLEYVDLYMVKCNGQPNTRTWSRTSSGAGCAKWTSRGFQSNPVTTRPARTQAASRNSAVCRAAALPPAKIGRASCRERV